VEKKNTSGRDQERKRGRLTHDSRGKRPRYELRRGRDNVCKKVAKRIMRNGHLKEAAANAVKAVTPLLAYLTLTANKVSIGHIINAGASNPCKETVSLAKIDIV